MGQGVTQTFLPPACPSCGTPLPDSAAFCPGCGRRVQGLKGQESSILRRTATHSGGADSPESHPSTEWASTELPPRYRPIRLLGRGGMGVVFHCQDTVLERGVAIKLISERYRQDPKAERRFLREARAQATLNHLNVAQVLNVGVSTGGRPFLVMEYVEGRDLRQVLRDFPDGLPPVQACDWMIQCCAGLAEAHTGGIIHRDLKPSNLILCRDHGGRDLIKILDLGLAKIVGGASDLKTITIDTAGMLVGTPAYMSPEQVAGSVVDARSDLYSLGVVFFEMLTGRLPFESESVEGWLYQHMHAEPPAPSLLRPELGAISKLDDTVLWLLAKNAHERPSRAQELSGVIQRILTGLTYSQGEGAGVELPDEPLGSIDRMSSSANIPKPNPAVLRTQFLNKHESALKELTPPPNPDRHERYLVFIRAAENAARERRWEDAIESYRQALEYAEDRDSVFSQIEALQRELNFDQQLATCITYASAGDWARAEGALAKAAGLSPTDARLEQARARMPRRLVEAWLEAARTRLSGFAEGNPRQSMRRRLAMVRARLGDMPNAIRTLQEDTRDAELRMLGLAQAVVAASKAGIREGLRPYLERLLGAAVILPDSGMRGRACLETAKAFAAYGDHATARELFQKAAQSFREAGSQYSTPTSLRLADLGGPRTVTGTFRRAARPNAPNKESALLAVTQAQADALYAEEATATAQMIEDAWTRAQAQAIAARAFGAQVRPEEAERLALSIGFSLPRAQGLRAAALARIQRHELEQADALAREIGVPEERAPVQAALAEGWVQRGNVTQAEHYAREALASANEVTGQASRLLTLLSCIEPLLVAGRLTAVAPFLNAAGRLIDATESPADRLQSFVKLAHVRLRAADPHTQSYVFTQASPEVRDLLRRALNSLRLIGHQQERDEGFELLASAVAEAWAPELSEALLALCKNEQERALALLGLATGLA